MAKPDDSTDFVAGLDLSSLPHQKFILISEEENPILYMQIMNYCQTHRFTPQITTVFQHKIGTAVRRLRSGDLHPAVKSSRNPLSPSTDRNTSNAYRR